MGLRRLARSAGITIEYDRGYTIFPGHLHLAKLRLSGIADDGWLATIDAADVDVGLLDLVTLNGHLERVRATGASVTLGLPAAEIALAPSSGAPARRTASSLAAGFPAPARPSPGPEAQARSERLLRVDAFDASVNALTLGRRSVRGAMDARVRSLFLRRHGTTVEEAVLSLHDAKLAHDEETIVRAIEGSVSGRIEPSDADASSRPASILARMTARTELRGELVSIAPIASLAGLRSSVAAGSLRVSGALERGTLALSSTLRAELGRVHLEDAHGAVAAFPLGLAVTLGRGVEPDAKLRFSFRSPRAELPGSAGDPEDTLEDVMVEVDAGDANLLSARPAERALQWSAGRLVVHEGSTVLSAALHGDLDIVAAALDTEVVSANAGEITATAIVVERPPEGERAPFQARLKVTRAELSRESGALVAGELHASGADAGTLMTLLGAKPALHLALSAIEKQPFTLDGAVARRPGSLAVEGIELSSGSVTLSGAYYRRAAEQRAAFVLRYGAFPLGISVVDDADTIVMAPPTGWLATESAAAASALAS